MKLWLLASILVHEYSLTVYPEHYTFLTGTSVNGSSPTGNCSNVSMDGTMTTCLQPTSSVLFDGHVPTLIGVDGDMWASQLLTINTTQSLTTVIFDFTDTPGYDRIEQVEVVMFNCPWWRIASTYIDLLGATTRDQSFYVLYRVSVSSLTSCDSLVRVCLSTIVSRPLIGLQFILDKNSDWVHLAEVTFYARGLTCPANVILTLSPPTTSPPVTTAQVTTPSVTTPPVITAPGTQSYRFPYATEILHAMPCMLLAKACTDMISTVWQELSESMIVFSK